MIDDYRDPFDAVGNSVWLEMELQLMRQKSGEVDDLSHVRTSWRVPSQSRQEDYWLAYEQQQFLAGEQRGIPQQWTTGLAPSAHSNPPMDVVVFNPGPHVVSIALPGPGRPHVWQLEDYTYEISAQVSDQESAPAPSPEPESDETTQYPYMREVLASHVVVLENSARDADVAFHPWSSLNDAPEIKTGFYSVTQRATTAVLPWERFHTREFRDWVSDEVAVRTEILETENRSPQEEIYVRANGASCNVLGLDTVVIVSISERPAEGIPQA